MRPLYVKLTDDERNNLDMLTVEASVAAGRLVSVTAVVRQLIADAIKRDKPIRVRS